VSAVVVHGMSKMYIAVKVHTLGGKPSCVTVVVGEDIPKVLRFAKLWKPIGEVCGTNTQ
jgi:hypothetical protein